MNRQHASLSPIAVLFGGVALIVGQLAASIEPAAAQDRNCYQARSHRTGERVLVCQGDGGRWTIVPRDLARPTLVPRDRARPAPQPDARSIERLTPRLAPVITSGRATRKAPAGQDPRDDNLAMQNALTAVGCNSGLADGVWGAQSRRAARCFQRTIGAPETGLLTDEQANWLDRLAQGGATPPVSGDIEQAMAPEPPNLPSARNDSDITGLRDDDPQDAPDRPADIGTAPELSAPRRGNAPAMIQGGELDPTAAAPEQPTGRVGLPRIADAPQNAPPLQGPDPRPDSRVTPDDRAAASAPAGRDLLVLPRVIPPAGPEPAAPVDRAAPDQHASLPPMPAGPSALAPPPAVDETGGARDASNSVATEPPVAAQDPEPPYDPVGLPDLRIDVSREPGRVTSAPDVSPCQNAPDSEDCLADEADARDQIDAIDQAWRREDERIAAALGDRPADPEKPEAEAAPTEAAPPTEDALARARKAEIARLAPMLGIEPDELTGVCRQGMRERQDSVTPITTMFNRVCRAHAYSIDDAMLKLGYDARLAAAGDKEAAAAMAQRRRDAEK